MTQPLPQNLPFLGRRPRLLRPPRPPRRPWSLGEIIAWAVILITVGLAVGMTVLAKSSAEANADQTENLQLDYVGRYALGVKKLSELLPPTPINWSEYQSATDKIARSPRDLARAAILSGELEGPAQALKRLDQLQRLYPKYAKETKLLASLITIPPPRSTPPSVRDSSNATAGTPRSPSLVTCPPPTRRAPRSCRPPSARSW